MACFFNLHAREEGLLAPGEEEPEPVAEAPCSPLGMKGPRSPLGADAAFGQGLIASHGIFSDAGCRITLSL